MTSFPQLAIDGAKTGGNNWKQKQSARSGKEARKTKKKNESDCREHKKPNKTSGHDKEYCQKKWRKTTRRTMNRTAGSYEMRPNAWAEKTIAICQKISESQGTEVTTVAQRGHWPYLVIPAKARRVWNCQLLKSFGGGGSGRGQNLQRLHKRKPWHPTKDDATFTLRSRQKKKRNHLQPAAKRRKRRRLKKKNHLTRQKRKPELTWKSLSWTTMLDNGLRTKKKGGVHESLQMGKKTRNRDDEEQLKTRDKWRKGHRGKKLSNQSSNYKRTSRDKQSKHSKRPSYHTLTK